MIQHIYTDRTISFSSSIKTSLPTAYTTPEGLATSSTRAKALRASRIDAEPEARDKLNRPAAAPPELLERKVSEEEGLGEANRNVSDDDSDSDAAPAISRSSRRPQSSLPSDSDVLRSPHFSHPTSAVQTSTLEDSSLPKSTIQHSKQEKKDTSASTSNDNWDAPPPDLDEETSLGEKFQEDFDGEDWIKPPPGEDSGEGDDHYAGEDEEGRSLPTDQEGEIGRGGNNLVMSEGAGDRPRPRSRSSIIAPRQAQQLDIETESEDDFIRDQSRKSIPTSSEDRRSERGSAGKIDGNSFSNSESKQKNFPPPPPRHPSLTARTSRSSPYASIKSASTSPKLTTAPTTFVTDAGTEDRSRSSKSKQTEPVSNLEQAMESNLDEEKKQRKEERKRSKSKSRAAKEEATEIDEEAPVPTAKVRPKFPPHMSAPPASSIPEVATVQLAIAKEAVGSWFRGIGEMIKAQTVEVPVAEQEFESDDEEEEARRARRKQRRKKRKERERLEAETTAAEDETRTEQEKQERRQRKQDRIKAAREAEIEAEAELTRREEKLIEKELEIERKEALAKIELESRQSKSPQQVEAKKVEEAGKASKTNMKGMRGSEGKPIRPPHKAGARSSESSEEDSEPRVDRRVQGTLRATKTDIESDKQENRHRQRGRKIDSPSSASEDSGMEESKRGSRATTRNMDTDREHSGRASRRRVEGNLSVAESSLPKDKIKTSAQDTSHVSHSIELKESVAKPPMRQRAMSLSASVDAGLRLFGESVAKAVSTQIESLKSVAIDSAPGDDTKGTGNVGESWEERRGSRKLASKEKSIERSKSTRGSMTDGESDRSATCRRRGSRNPKDGRVSGAATDVETDYSSRSHRRGSSVASFLSESSDDESNAVAKKIKGKVNSEAEDVDEVAKANAAGIFDLSG